ncbi:MAG: nitroreductase family protein [Chloroflexia bacterium]|jgi:nitroreductase|nr:nitroreductase family protein [Chloroflexia bacterium]
MEFHDVVRKRRMVRNFTDEPIPGDVIDRIVEAGQHAPSAGFSQGVVYVVVTDKEMRQAIGEIAGEEHYVRDGFDPFISGAPVQIVICTSEQVYHDRYNERDKRAEGEEEIDWPTPYWHTDAGASLMLILLAAVNEGLGTAFVGVFDPPALQKLLGIPEEYLPIGVTMVGHAAPDRKSGSLKRGRRSLDDVLHRERW